MVTVMPLVTVYDIHPGVAGCRTQIPESLRCAAESMRGQRIELAEVVDRLRDAVPDGAFELSDHYIGYGNGRQMFIPCASPGLLAWENNWRVMRIER